MTRTFIATFLAALSVLLGACNPQNSAPTADTSTGEAPPQTDTPAPQSGSAPASATEPAAENEQPANDPMSTSSLVIDTSPYDGPAFSVEIVQAKRLPPISTAMIAVTVPTGGWRLNMDKSEVVGNTARVFLTLERPGEDERVTQALQTHQQQFTSEDPPFSKAEVYVFLAQRDIYPLTSYYRHAASR